MRKSSRGALEEKKRQEALLAQVSLVPSTEESRWMWMVMHMDIVLMDAQTCDTVREFLRFCEHKGRQQSAAACMVALGLHACSCSRRGLGYWFGLEGDGVRFISNVWMCGLQSWVLRMLPWFEPDARFFLSTCVLANCDRLGIDSASGGAEIVCCSLHYVICCLVDNHSNDYERLVGLIDTALLVLSGIEGFSWGCDRKHTSCWEEKLMSDIGKLETWIENKHNDYGFPGLYRLKSRLMLLEYKHTELTEDVPTWREHTESEHEATSVSRMRHAFDVILYWSSSVEHDDEMVEYIAYACWNVSNTLFQEHTQISGQHPSPVAEYKILCSILDRLTGANKDVGALDQIACWALACSVDDVDIQQHIVDAYGDMPSSVRVETIENGTSSLQYEWVRHCMILMGNKLAVDDTSSGGIVVGQHLEARMGTIRNLVFPAVLFCPYNLIHKLFNAALTNRNDVIMLSAICTVFPQLMQLPGLGNHNTATASQSTELSRLIIGRVIMSKDISEEEDSSLMYMIEVLMSAKPPILTLGMFHNGIVHMLSSPDASPEFATKFVKRLLELSTTKSICEMLQPDDHGSNQYAAALLEKCLQYLEFDTRYQCQGMSTGETVLQQYLEKSALQHVQDIVLTIAERLMDWDTSYAQQVLTSVEYQGHPWARLYFGIDFTEYEANYILKVNPKSSQLKGNCFGVENIVLHQALELAALGSIQAQMLKVLAHEYASMEHLRSDIVRSVACILSVCTSSEAQHLFHGVEVISGDVFIGTNANVHKPHIIQACTRAMTAEIGIKAVKMILDITHDAQASMALSDVCRYCLQCITQLPSSVSPMLALRLFGDILTSFDHSSIQSSSIEATISSLAQGIVTGSRSLSQEENTLILHAASDMVRNSAHSHVQYISALSTIFKT